MGMLFRALAADFLKIRRKGLWALAIFAPFGVVLLQAVNFGLRYDYLVKQYAEDLWGGLLHNIFMFVPISLFLGCVLVSSLLANVEHVTGSWKQLLVLPISRLTVFSAKFALSAILLACSCLLLAVFSVALGVLLGFGWHFPLTDVLRLSFYPYAGALPMLACMLWLCMTFSNQGFSISAGIVTAMASMYLPAKYTWLPLNWPLLAFRGEQGELYVGAGILTGLVIFLLGSVHFGRRDVV
ncbi:ABC transporter permease [Paenibacillus algorifonticola]|uniref:ABC transporter permease n=1 Tax=Paenibacillus algorifonticola TaxID=684063 RepID=UPI003D2B0CF0